MIEALRAANGDVELAYEVRGSGPPLLLVQGLGYGGRGWGPALELLAEDFVVVSLLMPRASACSE